MPDLDVSGIILAGGGSTRMGEDKALLRHESITMLEIVGRRLAPLVTETVVVGPVRADVDPSLRFVADDFPGEGPLGGLISGLRRIESGCALVVGCDMPNLSLRVLKGLVDLMRDEDDAVVPRVLGRVQPLHALYSLSALPKLEGVFQVGGRSVRHALADLSVQWVEIANARDADSFVSIDTPEQWARLASPAEQR